MKSFHTHAFRFSSWRKEPASLWFVLFGLIMEEGEKRVGCLESFLWGKKKKRYLIINRYLGPTCYNSKQISIFEAGSIDTDSLIFTASCFNHLLTFIHWYNYLRVPVPFVYLTIHVRIQWGFGLRLVIFL